MNLLKKILSLGVFILYFLIVFRSFPKNNSLPGNTDTIYNLSIFKDYGNRVSAFISNETIGNALYPQESMQQFAELYLGEAFIFNVIDVFSSDDIFTYYLFISILFAFNGWAAYLLAFHFFKKHLPSIVVGLVLSSSSFAFSQIELLNGIPYAPFCLSLLFFFKYLKHTKLKYLLYASILAAVQFYFSNYIFVYLLFTFILFLVLSKGSILFQKRSYLHLSIALVLGVALLVPYGIFANWGIPIREAYNPMDLELIKKFSLAINDFWRHLPNHRLYDLPQPEILNETLRNVNFAFIGLSTYAILVLALIKKDYSKNKVRLIALVIIGLVWALGPYLNVGGDFYKMPLYPAYKYFDLQNFIRIPPRAFSLAILAIALLIGMYLSSLKKSTRILLSLVFILFFFLENVPERFNVHPSKDFLTLPENLQDFEFTEAVKDVNISILPSSLLSGKKYNEFGLSEFSREYLYAYWQTQIKVNMINGMCGFFPESRLRNNELMQNIDQEKELKELIKLNDLDYLMVMKDEKFFLNDSELKQTKLLPTFTFLTLVSSSETMDIYSTNY